MGYSGSVRQNIRLILTTPKGSDIHRPDFGSDLWKFMDQPLNAITLGRIKAEITDAIETWEPRVKVLSVELDKDYRNANSRSRCSLK
ncbi:MAG: GPW/gp25 family protein [Aquificota bacterium]|nr:GPW/gp25 family protein [Aquificota bacterium]